VASAQGEPGGGVCTVEAEERTEVSVLCLKDKTKASGLEAGGIQSCEMGVLSGHRVRRKRGQEAK